MKLSIRTRLILSFVGVIALVLICQVAFNLFFAKQYYLSYQENMMRKTYEQLVQDFDGSLDSIENAAASYESNYDIEVIVWVDELVWYTSYDRLVYQSGTRVPAEGEGEMAMPNNGEITDGVERVPREDDLSAGGGRGEQSNTIAMPDINTPQLGNVQNEIDILHFVGSFTYQDSTVVVELARSLDSIESSADVFTRSSMLISCIALFIGLLYSLFLSKSITKPITEMERIAGEFANLDFSNKANEAVSATELYHLSKSLNSMSTQLERAISSLNVVNEKLKKDIDYQKQMEQMRREFVGNVSHEMKTPLTMLQIYAESLKDNIESVDKDYYCDTIMEETKILNDLVASMLDISSIESGLSKMQMDEVDVSQLLSSLLERMRPLLAAYQVETEITSGITLLGDEKYLEQAMKNYLNNAIEHTEKGEKIKVSLIRQGDGVCYRVDNVGKAIPEEAMSRLWDSFYRADKARSRGNKNVGLGLHIVKTVLEKHEGSCKCENTPDGVSFSFWLPDRVPLSLEETD